MTGAMIVGVGKASGGEMSMPESVEALPLEFEDLMVWILALDEQRKPGRAERAQWFLKKQWELWRKHQLVPFRYGQRFDGEATMDRLKAHQRHWSHEVNRLGGCGEISLFFPGGDGELSESSDGQRSSSGRDYLMARQKIYRRREERPEPMRRIQRRIRRALPSIREERALESGGRWEWSLLFGQTDLVQALKAIRRVADVDYKGPFPPWTFIGEVPEA